MSSDVATALKAQRDLFYAARASARVLGHEVRHEREPATATLVMWCEQCLVRSEFPVQMALTEPTLPNIYCPRRPADAHTRRDFWMHPTEHRADVAKCLCDACVYGPPEQRKEA